MKATGIVRRIDDLGRVVIPKEIRRTMRIREGDPLEIYTDADGEVIFKKYSPVGELSPITKQFADVLYRNTDMAVLVFDRDKVISSAGLPKKEALERRVTQTLENIMEKRATYVGTKEMKKLQPAEGLLREASVAVPIIGGGDVSGAVVLLKDENSDKEPTQTEIKLTQMAASFLGRQMEE